jgi:hypothetical protein
MTTGNKVGYAIPRENEQYIVSREKHAEEKLKPHFNIDNIYKNARIVVGCRIIQFDYKFISLLDEAYKSF